MSDEYVPPPADWPVGALVRIRLTPDPDPDPDPGEVEQGSPEDEDG